MRIWARALGAALGVLLALTLMPKPPAAVAGSGRCAAAYPTFGERPRRGASCSPLVIMPLGDSITYGYQSTSGDGYRGPLQDLINTRRTEAWQYAGSVVSGGRGLRHEGHGGWTCVQLLASLDGWLPVVTPVAVRVSVVLLDAGTNDTRAGATGAATAACLEQLLARIAVREPEARVVLAQITITTAAAPAVQQEQRALNGALPALAAVRGARLVDMTGVELAPDGIHPDDAGYADMAGRWMAALTGWI